MFEELDDIIEKNDHTPEEKTETKGNSKQFQSDNKWLAEEQFTGREINIDTLRRGSKEYIVMAENVPEELASVYVELGMKLSSLGYSIRNGHDKRNKLERLFVENIPGPKVKHYLPWSGFDDTKDGEVTKPTKEAFELACYYGWKFNEQKPAIKTFNAIAMHRLFGATLADPVDFILIYSDDGAVSINEVTSATGFNNRFLINLATKANIKLFNFGNSDSRKSFKDFLSTL